MLIKLIQEHAEKVFLESLETDPSNRRVVIWEFSASSHKPDSEMALSALKEALRNAEGELYFCSDGDIVICWRGRGVEPAIKEACQKAFPTAMPGSGSISAFYDTVAENEELRLMMLRKLKHPVTKPIPAPKPKEKFTLAFTKEEITEGIPYKIAERKSRRDFCVMVVEDQEFSLKLLVGLLQKEVICYGAGNGRDAVSMYAEFLPDLTFLDIELPDTDGHQLAALFRKHDPDAKLVMVTANNYLEDVEKAKANKVQGFIAKPYNKKKVMDIVDTYMKLKSKQSG